MSLVFTFIDYQNQRWLAGDRRVLDGHTVWGTGSKKIFELDWCVGGAVGTQVDYFAFQEALATITALTDSFEHDLSLAIREHGGMSKDFEGMLVLTNNEGIDEVYQVDRCGSCCQVKSSHAAIGCPDAAIGYLAGLFEWSRDKLDAQVIARSVYNHVRAKEMSVGGGLDIVKVS